MGGIVNFVRVSDAVFPPPPMNVFCRFAKVTPPNSCTFFCFGILVEPVCARLFCVWLVRVFFRMILFVHGTGRMGKSCHANFHE